jgi:uncharacterized protein with LGFP repeats
MESAGNWLFFDQLGASLTAMGLQAPGSPNDATNVGICFAVKGAADLVHPVPATEAERQENRRVRLLVITFAPFTLAFDVATRLGMEEQPPLYERL